MYVNGHPTFMGNHGSGPDTYLDDLNAPDISLGMDYMAQRALSLSGQVCGVSMASLGTIDRYVNALIY